MKIKNVLITIVIMLIVLTISLMIVLLQPEKVELGDSIAVRYQGKFLNGTVFDDNLEDEEALEFVVGSGSLIKGFEEGVIGMKQGEKRSIRIPPEKGYGLSDPALIQNLTLDEFAVKYPRIELELGRMFSYTKDNGKMGFTRIVDITDDYVILDANSRLAGKDLIFDVEIVGLEKTSEND